MGGYRTSGPLMKLIGRFRKSLSFNLCAYNENYSFDLI